MEGGGFWGGVCERGGGALGGRSPAHRALGVWHWFWSVTAGCVETLVVCTSLPLINIGALLTVCIQKILNTIGYFGLGNPTP